MVMMIMATTKRRKGGDEPIHCETDRIEQRPGRHHQQWLVFFKPARHPELEQHDDDGVDAQQPAVTYFGQPVLVTQVHTERGVHVHVDEGHHHGHADECQEWRIFEDPPVTGERLFHRFRLDMRLCLRFRLGQGEKDDRRADQADDGIHDEECEIGVGDQQACNRRGNDDRQLKTTRMMP